MKKLILLVLTLAMLSCSDDDSNSGSGLKPSRIAVGNLPEDVRTFTYDNKNRLETVTFAGTTGTFTYDNQNRVERVSRGDVSFTFQYNDQDKYVSFTTQGGEVNPIMHLGENNYTYNGQNLNFTTDGDWLSFSGSGLTYSDDKGPFANARHLNFFALALMDEASVYYASKKRRIAIVNGDNVEDYTTVEGDNGFPVSTFVYDIMSTYTYE